MDLKMKAESISSTANPVWDLKVENGIVPIITDDEESIQNATLAGFLELGTIPTLPDAGVPWSDYMTQQITFGELDADVRESIEEAGQSGFYPQYEIEDDKLVMLVTKEVTE